MEEQAKALAAEQGLAWVKPTLDPYASHDLVEGLVRLPAEPAPLTEAELARLDELDASYDEHAAILEDEDSAEEAVAAAEAAIEAIERECQEIRARPPVIAPELKAEAGMILVLSRDGTPVLQPVFYGERQAEPAEGDRRDRSRCWRGRFGQAPDAPCRSAWSTSSRCSAATSWRCTLPLIPGWRSTSWSSRSPMPIPTTGGRALRPRCARLVPAGPIIGFEAKDAPASSALAELRSNLDESWRAGEDALPLRSVPRAVR
jgi:ParB family chromosome partitioning protein